MHSYKINDFAKRIGVTVKTLRHYEKFRIVSPTINAENGYRFYTFRDAERIISAKRFSSMGFSVRETSELLDNCTGAQVMELLRARADDAAREAARLALMAKRLQELRDETKLFLTHPNQALIGQSKEYWFVPHVSDDSFLHDSRITAAVHEMMDAMPFSSKMMHLNSDQSSYIWGLAIEATYASALGMKLPKAPGESQAAHSNSSADRRTVSTKDPLYEYIPASRCMILPFTITRPKGNRAGSDWYTMLTSATLELERLHLTATGSMFVIGGIDSFDSDFREKHFLIFVPIAD